MRVKSSQVKDDEILIFFLSILSLTVTWLVSFKFDQSETLPVDVSGALHHLSIAIATLYMYWDQRTWCNNFSYTCYQNAQTRERVKNVVETIWHVTLYIYIYFFLYFIPLYGPLSYSAKYLKSMLRTQLFVSKFLQFLSVVQTETVSNVSSCNKCPWRRKQKKTARAATL